jgi:P27 family predicted phage terminase small subunit
MRRGRKPKPSYLKLITGNPGGRPLNAREAKPDPGMPAPPSWLSEGGLAEWNRLGPKLHRLGLLTEIDGATFGARCQIVGDMADVEARIRKFGAIMRASDRRDRLVLSPFARLRDRLREQLLRFDAEFGLTPSARSRVSASPPPVSKADPAAKYFR